MVHVELNLRHVTTNITMGSYRQVCVAPSKTIVRYFMPKSHSKLKNKNIFHIYVYKYFKIVIIIEFNSFLVV